MDTRTGQIYDSLSEAVAAGVPEQHLVTGDRSALEPLSRLIQRRNAAREAQPPCRSARARAKAKRAIAAASRKRNRR